MHSHVMSVSSKYGDKRTNVCCRKDMCSFSYLSDVHVIKVQSQKDIYMGKSQTDLCPFSYWRAREGSSECTGKFHQSLETKKKKKK